MVAGGGVCGCRGACMVAGGMHAGGAWLLGGMRGCWGVHGCWGACVVVGGVHAYGGCAWLPGGVHGCRGACVVAGGACVVGGLCVVAGGCIGYDEIRSMSGRYASYWNAFLFGIPAAQVSVLQQNSCQWILLLRKIPKKFNTFSKLLSVWF